MGDPVNSRPPAQSRNRDRRRAAPNEYDPLLPSQYYERVAGGYPPSGEFKLFFAILEDALRSYVRCKDCRSASKRAEFLDAQLWFHTRGTPHLFCFESVCSFLGIDPEWLRERLKSLTPTDFPLKQYRTRRRRPARSSAHPEKGQEECAPEPSMVEVVVTQESSREDETTPDSVTADAAAAEATTSAHTDGALAGSSSEEGSF